MKNLWEKWIFTAQFHFQDPDPDSEYGSGSSMAIWIRIQPDPDPKHWYLGTYQTTMHMAKNFQDICIRNLSEQRFNLNFHENKKYRKILI